MSDGSGPGGRTYNPELRVRVPKELIDRIDREAKDRMLGRHVIVAKALERGLDQLVPLPEDP